MNETYYAELIAKVRQNEAEMWNQADDTDAEAGFDDFSKLWNILSDDDAQVSAETYFQAMDLCTTSFFGSIQDRKPVWDNILNRYRQALGNPADVAEFRNAFIDFADLYNCNEETDCVDRFNEMMHMAIDAADPEMATAVMKCAFCSDLWTDERKYPEWSVWFAVFSDKDFSEIPHTPQTTAALNELYSKLSAHPDMDRLRQLHAEY